MKNLCLAAVISLLVMSNPAMAAAPITSDSDKDGLSDEQERLFKTDPNNADTDGDGYFDGTEVKSGHDPLAKDKKLIKKIVIDTKKQELSYFLGEVKLGTFKASTGKPSMPTPKGTFKINNKYPNAWSRTYGLWMPYWMSFKTGYGIHELPYWPGGYREGTNHLGLAVSHGCVRLGIGPAKTLYDWAEVGTSVFIN